MTLVSCGKLYAIRTQSFQRMNKGKKERKWFMWKDIKAAKIHIGIKRTHDDVDKHYFGR